MHRASWESAERWLNYRKQRDNRNDQHSPWICVSGGWNPSPCFLSTIGENRSSNLQNRKQLFSAVAGDSIDCMSLCHHSRWQFFLNRFRIFKKIKLINWFIPGSSALVWGFGIDSISSVIDINWERCKFSAKKNTSGVAIGQEYIFIICAVPGHSSMTCAHRRKGRSPPRILRIIFGTKDWAMATATMWFSFVCTRCGLMSFAKCHVIIHNKLSIYLGGFFLASPLLLSFRMWLARFAVWPCISFCWSVVSGHTEWKNGIDKVMIKCVWPSRKIWRWGKWR